MIIPAQSSSLRKDVKMKFIEVTLEEFDKKVSFKVNLINAFGPYKGGTKLIFNDNSSIIVKESYDDIRSKINAALWWESKGN